MKTLKNPQPPRILPTEQAIVHTIRLVSSFNR
jgi:hypothetical protein